MTEEYSGHERRFDARDIIIERIQPMELRLKGMEKDVEHLTSSVNHLSDKIDGIDSKMDGIDTKVEKGFSAITNRLGKIVSWGAGVGSAIGLVVVVWQFAIPFIQALPK